MDVLSDTQMIFFNSILVVEYEKCLFKTLLQLTHNQTPDRLHVSNILRIDRKVNKL